MRERNVSEGYKILAGDGYRHKYLERKKDQMQETNQNPYSD